MKKILLVLIMLLVILYGVDNEKDFCLKDYFSGEYVVYSSTDLDVSSVNLGFCYINSEKSSGDILGESMTIKDLEVGDALSKLNARVVKTEYLEDGTIVIYAYSSLIKEKVEVFGEYVNLQIATRKDVSIVGWPLILGSY